MLFFNPLVTRMRRVPNSVLQAAAAVRDLVEIDIIDGNCEADPWPSIEAALSTGQVRYFGVTVMPGPQLKQAVPITRAVREAFPDVTILWGGYFPSNQPDVVMQSGLVDYVLDGPADVSLRKLLLALLGQEGAVADVPGLIYHDGGAIRRTKQAALPNQDSLPPLPMDVLTQRYPMSGYTPRTFLGSRTHAMHTSMGCPFMCSFCAVVPIFNGGWKGMSADRVAADVLAMRDQHGVDAIEFTDNNFFVSEKRVKAFSAAMMGQGITWWGEGRIDTIDKFSDETLAEMRAAGCRAIFFGAESGDDSQLAEMNKGGKQTGAQILDFAERMGRFDIVPEYSFVLGFPKPTEAEVWGQICSDIDFIRQVKRRNPATEIILYIYSPVPTEGSDLYQQITQAGFAFPQTLDEWLTPVWENFDLHRNPLTPWLTPQMVQHIHDFETVLNARYPTRSHFRTAGLKRRVMQAVAVPRYALGLFRRPVELKALQRLYRYVRPETEGFYAEV